MGADLGKLEQEARALLDGLKSPGDIGKVYARIARMYAEHSGGRKPKKAIFYATQALEYPLEPADKARVYLGWGIALWAQCNTVDSQEYFRHRREISTLFLKCLALLIEMGVMEEPVELPSVDKFDIDSRDPEYQNYVKRHEMQMAARKRAEEMNRLQSWRFIVTKNLVGLYALGPDEREELKNLALGTLKNEAAATSLMAVVSAARTRYRKA